MSVVATRPPSAVVGISTRNRAAELEKAIVSALAQTFRPLRVAVVDDASSDGTPLLRNRFSEVTWQRWDEPGGYVHARNQMMLNADEDYYVSLDDDAWFVAGDEIGIAVDYLEAHPGVAAVAFDILSPGRPHAVPRRPGRPAAMFIGCGHVLRLSAVKMLGGYAAFPGYYGAEEKDLCLRLVDADYGIVILDGVHVWHDMVLRERDLDRQHRSGVCNDLVFELRRCPLILLGPVLAWKTMRHVSFAVRNSLTRACFQGFGQFIASIGPAWRSRNPVRASAYLRYLALIRKNASAA